MMKFIMARAPKHGRTRATLWLEDLHLNYLFKESNTLVPDERIEFSFSFSNAVLEGRQFQDVYMVMTNLRIHLFQANYAHWFQFGSTEKLPWWSDSSRYMPMPTGMRGWDNRFLLPIHEPLNIKDIGSVNIRTTSQNRNPEFIIAMGDLEKEQTSAIGSFFGFSKDSFASALRFELPTYACLTHVHEAVKLAMVHAGHNFRYIS